MPRKKKAESSSSLSEQAPANRKTAARGARKATSAAPKAPRAKRPSVPRAAKAVGRSKAKAGAVPHGSLPLLKKIPRRGETQMVAFIRDPQCLFTYWEVSPEDVEEVKKKLMDEYKDSSMVLMVFKSGLHGEVELLYEVKVEPGERNRYLELKEPGGRYFVQVAQKTASGRVIPYVRSNTVMTGVGAGVPSSPQSQWQPPAGILEYFADEEAGLLPTAPPWGISSAEWQRRKKAQEARYAASRIR